MSRAVSKETKEKMRQSAIKMWKRPGFRKKIVDANLGKKASKETKEKLSNNLKEQWKDPVLRQKRTEGIRKSKMGIPAWNHGLKTSDKSQKYQRNYPETSRWRQIIFERDDYTCQECLTPSSGNINAHHIKSWVEYSHLRLKIWNGITLCKECHQNYHSS